jgi:hypothetical protein
LGLPLASGGYDLVSYVRHAVWRLGFFQFSMGTVLAVSITWIRAACRLWLETLRPGYGNYLRSAILSNLFMIV